jgi:hypothetical protein
LYNYLIKNIADGEAQAILQQNLANIESFSKIQDSQTEGYKKLKNSLGLNNSDLVNLIKAKLIKNYEGSDIVLNVKTPEA